MRGIWDSALGLLVVTGGLLGLTLPFGKLATERGLPATLWALVISGGAGLVLLAALVAGRRVPAPNVWRLRYFAVTAAISYAIPNILMFSVMPHVGAGYTGILITLSPVITLVLSMLLGVRRPNRLGVLGIAVGFVGAAMVAATRGEAGRPAELFWVGLGLMIPVSLALGNIYRTIDWPADTGPIALAAGSHLAAAVMLVGGLAAAGDAGAVRMLGEVPGLALAQVAAASGMFVFYFRLQAVGGPVYLSQIGYVAAAVALVAGVAFLGERYASATWAGAAIVVLGVALTTKAQAAPNGPRDG